jgi:hypothetical protein
MIPLTLLDAVRQGNLSRAPASDAPPSIPTALITRVRTHTSAPNHSWEDAPTSGAPPQVPGLAAAISNIRVSTLRTGMPARLSSSEMKPLPFIQPPYALTGLAELVSDRTNEWLEIAEGAEPPAHGSLRSLSVSPPVPTPKPRNTEGDVQVEGQPDPRDGLRPAAAEADESSVFVGSASAAVRLALAESAAALELYRQILGQPAGTAAGVLP